MSFNRAQSRPSASGHLEGISGGAHRILVGRGKHHVVCPDAARHGVAWAEKPLLRVRDPLTQRRRGRVAQFRRAQREEFPVEFPGLDALLANPDTGPHEGPGARWAHTRNRAAAVRCTGSGTRPAHRASRWRGRVRPIGAPRRPVSAGPTARRRDGVRQPGPGLTGWRLESSASSYGPFWG